MSNSRDLGLQTLQSGDVAGAIQQLEAACGADGSDYLAHIYLGAAYSQANRTMDAIQVLTRSVELQPSNAQGRYNLGLAMERGGFAEQAGTAYEQAITLQPDYPKAREALQRIRGGAAAQPAVPSAPPPPVAQAPLYGAPQGGAPAAQYNSPPGPAYAGAGALPPAYGSQQSGLNPPPQYGAPPVGAYPPQPTQDMQSQEPSGLANYGSAPGRQEATPLPYGSPYGGASQGAVSAIAPPTAPVPTIAPPGAGQFILAFVLGSVGGVIGLVLWVAITYITHLRIGYAAIGVGALIGWMTKLGTRQGAPAVGVMAAIISFLSIGLGCLLTGGSDLSIIFSIIFVAIGVSAAYRIAAS